ncbi:MAG: ArnT family glycosyltransferase [Halorientalis sp.]
MADRRARVALSALAVLAGVVVLWLAVDLFPHHSSNHDEGVYLQQAQLLLDGQLWLHSTVPEAVQPWFFVRDGGRLYPKYTPVPAGVFALGLAVGLPRLSLALVAVANVALVGLLAREATDARTAVLAAALFAASPLFLLDSAVFLPYAPTTALNLLFALAYVRACRSDGPTPRRRYAALAGGAIGLAFFARPFTAVLFGAPFVIHALLVLGTSWREGHGRRATHDGTATARVLGFERPVVERNALVAGLGIAGVGAALAYNAVVTGDPLVFPYQAFAPRDGLGFGVRRILGYERTYTPALALRANAQVLWAFLTRWAVAPPLGPLAAAVGLAVAAVRGWRAGVTSLPRTDGLSDHGVRALVAGLAVSVPLGNVFFWGNLNILAALDVPHDGLISLLGPFYHFDLLVPLAVFGALGLVATGRALRRMLLAHVSPRATRAGLAVAVVALLLVAGVAQVAALDGPVERNRQYTERYDRAYEPFAGQSFEDALVFVPTPYGDWLNHPFQSLRNDPGFDGSVVYALDRETAADFRVLDTFGDRQPYRYTYRGAWTPDVVAGTDPIVARLEPLRVVRGDRHRVTFTVGQVAGAQSATVRLSGPDATAHYGVDRLGNGSLTVRWTVGDGIARVNESDLYRFGETETVRFEGPTTLSLTVTFTQAGGATVSYRQEVAVEPTADGVRLVWPPETTVCRLVADCGHRGTYVPRAEDYVTGVSVTERIRSLNGTRSP